MWAIMSRTTSACDVVLMGSRSKVVMLLLRLLLEQAACGSCWAFGATAALQSAYWMATGRGVRFSEQQLMDCSWRFGLNHACDGGALPTFRVLHMTAALPSCLSVLPIPSRIDCLGPCLTSSSRWLGAGASSGEAGLRVANSRDGNWWGVSLAALHPLL